MKKVQFMVVIEAEQRDRMDALRIVMNVSRAEVLRQALTGAGLTALERHCGAALDRLLRVADHYRLSLYAYVQSVVEQAGGRQTLPTLDELEREAGIRRMAASP